MLTRPLRPVLLLALSSTLGLTAACSGDGSSTSSSGGSGKSSSSSGGSSGLVPQVDCGSTAGSVTLCDVQKPTSPNHPGNGVEVTFPDPLVVTQEPFVLSSSNGEVTKAFFVAEGSGGPYRGAMVKGPSEQIDALMLSVGTRVNLQVTVDEFAGTGSGTETQLTFVGGNVVGTAAAPAATVVDKAVFTSDEAAEAYEGVLVTVENATAVRFDSGAIAEYGAFRLEGGLLVDDQIFRYRAGIGETFTSITGFVRYSFDGKWTLLPRTEADVVSSGNPLMPRPTTIVEVQDPANAPNLPHCIPPAECEPLLLENMVVVSAPRVADKDASGKATLYSVFLQDTSQRDANDEPVAYAGVKLVFGRTGIETNYGLTVYGNLDYPDTRDSPQEWPMPGDVVTVQGSAQEYFGNTQVGGVTTLTRVGRFSDMTAPEGVKEAKPRSFTTEEELSELAGGAYGVAMCVDPVAPAAGAEKWEGMLVKLVNVTTTSACVPTATNSTSPPDCVLRDFGYFKVTGGVEIGTSQGVYFSDACATGSVCTCDGPTRVPNDRRVMDQVYDSITGVFDFSFDVFRVNPRTNDDVVVHTP